MVKRSRQSVLRHTSLLHSGRVGGERAGHSDWKERIDLSEVMTTVGEEGGVVTDVRATTEDFLRKEDPFTAEGESASRERW
jgi:hypothetical protein